MRREANLLAALETHAGYKVLEQLWLEDISEIEEKRDNAAKRGNESAWRYWAGMEKGAKQLMVKLKVTLAEWESESTEEDEQERLMRMAKELKGESPQ